MGTVIQSRHVPASKSAIGRFLQGARAPLDGFVYLNRHATLWRYAILPIVINLLITLVVLGGLAVVGYFALAHIHHMDYFATATLGWLQEILADILVIVALLALAVGSYLLVGGILSSHFNERLATKVELQLGTAASELKSLPFRYHVVDGIVDFAVIAGTAIGCLLIGCVPIVGAVLGPVINFYVDWFVFGYDYLDIPMALRGMRRADKRAFAKKHRAHVLGLGAVVFLMNFIPIIGSVFLTTAAVGGVLLHQRLKSADQQPAPPS